MNTHLRTTLLVMALLVFGVVAGCRDSTPVKPKVVPAPGAPDTPTVSVDDQVLRALDHYEPMYKINATGQVVRLRLGSKHLPPSVLAEVGKLKHLEALELYGTTVDDDGLAQLKDLQKLKSIGLMATEITDKGLVHLEKLGELRAAWVPKKNISAEAIQKMKEARPDLKLYQ